MRVVVIGGGYAGLACILELRALAPRAELQLVDPGAAHVKQTLLHEALHRPLADLSAPYADLSSRYGFVHHRCALGRDGVFDAQDLRAWHEAGRLPLDAGALAFDCLVVATGARPRLRSISSAAGGRSTRDQLDLRECEGRALVRERLLDDDGAVASVVGGGPSGVQYAFELAELMRRHRSAAAVRLIDTDTRVLRDLPVGAHAYVIEQMRAAGIQWLPRTAFVRQTSDALTLRDLDDERERELPSALTLLFGGVTEHPFALQADRFGRVVVEGATLARVFAAGDCARYAARGLDAMTAQAAVRKGKHVAANISRLHRGRVLVPYGFQELGYVVSMGTFDAVGWALVRENIVRGVAATALRRIVDAQYDLFVDGLDTYVV